MTYVRIWGFGFVGYFYTAFVLQTLWNWFAAPALHLDPIGYWQMYGLHMLMVVILRRYGVEDERWERSVLFMYASVRPENKAQVDEEVKANNENAGFKAGMGIFTILLENTIALGIGWAIHTFLI